MRRDAFVGARDSLSSRRLAERMPRLFEHIVPGARVLDVGCGPGSITCDLATCQVSPELVVGVDHSGALVAYAAEAARRDGIRNVLFLQGDACALPLSDGLFDVTCSNALLDWLVDPVLALKEQARVTRPGGIVFARMADLSTQSFHPPCPELRTLIEVLKRVARARFPDCHWDPFLGGSAVALFRAAGLEDIQVSGWADCFSSQRPDRMASLTQGILRAAVTPPFTAQTRRALEFGWIEPETLEKAAQQLEALIADPDGLSIRAGVFAWGSVS